MAPIELPTWMDTVVSRIAAMFSLNHWRIHLYPENAHNKPDGCEHADGVADMDTNYHDAKLFLNRDMEPDVYGFEVVAHEVLHLVFSDMRNTVSDITKFVFDEDQQKVLFDIYDRVEEQTITRLARGMARDFDFSLWLKKDEPQAEDSASLPAAAAHSEWRLIRDSDVAAIMSILNTFDPLSERAKRIRYLLDTGLHLTGAVPSDCVEERSE